MVTAMEKRYHFGSALEARARCAEILAGYRDPEYWFIDMPTGQCTLIIRTKEEDEHEDNQVCDREHGQGEQGAE